MMPDPISWIERSVSENSTSNTSKGSNRTISRSHNQWFMTSIVNAASWLPSSAAKNR